jgi:hypothetical protein
MKIFLLVSILVFLNSIALGQVPNIKLDSIATYACSTENIGFSIKINENGELQAVKVIDSLSYSREVLFSKVLSFFAYYYKDSKNTLELKDKESGIIIGKDRFNMFSTYTGNAILYTTKVSQSIDYSANYTFRIDVKEGRIRAIITTSNYSIKTTPKTDVLYSELKPIIKCEPFYSDYSYLDNIRISGVKPTRKILDFHISIMKESEPVAFIELCKSIKNTLENFEKSIKDGNINAEIEEW